MKKKFKTGSFGYGIVCGLLFAAVLFSVVACSFPDNENQIIDITQGAKQPSSDIDQDACLIKIEKIKGLLEKYYMDGIDYDKAMEGIYAGFVNSLGDPYTVYFSAEDYKSFAESTNGNYAGIGSTVTTNPEGNAELVKPFKDGPAYNAGLLPGDIIVSVDGENVLGMDLDAIVTKMKGPAGTEVKIQIYRPSVNEYIDYSVVRGNVQVPTIEYEMLDNKIGYVIVTEFDQVTLDQYLEAIDKLEADGMVGLIVDLRDNPGGMLTTVTGMLSRILPKGQLLVYTEDKYGQRDELFSTTRAEVKVPIAILINGNSASASEVFCGCLQDYGKATLVGTKSFGKGIVQSLLPLGDGSALKVTTSKYYSPKGRNIHGVGFEPDILVELDPELKTLASIPKEKDNQLQAAVKCIMDQLN